MDVFASFSTLFYLLANLLFFDNFIFGRFLILVNFEPKHQVCCVLKTIQQLFFFSPFLYSQHNLLLLLVTAIYISNNMRNVKVPIIQLDFKTYNVFQGFRQAKSANGGLILSPSQFLILSQLPQKMKLASKVVKVDSKIIILLPKI
jgi:hypothetical protein